jgi:hypothetical protein
MKNYSATKIDLAAALLWLRNHYDVDEIQSADKTAILDRVDRVLEDGPDLSIADMTAFRDKYPRREK